MSKYGQRKIKGWFGKEASQRTRNRTNYVGAPSASPDTMRIYEELLLKAVRSKSFKACIFGATPEIRDLVLKHGGQLTTVDISPDMIKKCNALMKYQDHKNETVIEADWLDNSLDDNQFDVVMGDGTSNNVAYKDQDKLFGAMNKLLKKDGHLVLRDGSTNPIRTIKTTEEINKEFISGKIHWFDMFVQLYFYSDITEKTCLSTKYERSFKKLWLEIEKAYQQKKLSKKAFDALWWFRGDLVHTFMPKSLLEKYIAKYFHPLPTRQAQDYQFTKDTFLFFPGRAKN